MMTLLNRRRRAWVVAHRDQILRGYITLAVTLNLIVAIITLRGGG